VSEPSANPMRQALRAMTHGVYVLSVRHAEHDEYIIVALAMQCSVEPPRVALAVSHNARILEPLLSAGGAVFSVLSVHQVAAIRRYGTPGGVRHRLTERNRSANGHPIPPEGSFWMELRIVSESDGGDHRVLIADVIDAGANASEKAEGFEPLTLAASKLPYGG